MAHADDQVVVAAVAPPLAPPSALPPVPSPPPQNEDWSNVSHINGQLVKVGERGDYLYRYRRLDVMGDPFGLFFGYYDLSVSYGLSQNLAISGSVALYSHDGGTMTQVTVSLPIYFRRTYSGPFLEPGLITRNSSDSCDDCSSDSWAGPELLFGWHWSYDSGLNIALAAGPARHMGSSDDSDVDVNGYFRIGYAF
ncbi:MAG TPA: hypothetical protein VLX92_31775 [Kofleriaceae bacterium]|nr:hypothetical protein [Kofleriaceae bacterium]